MRPSCFGAANLVHWRELYGMSSEAFRWDNARKDTVVQDERWDELRLHVRMATRTGQRGRLLT